MTDPNATDDLARLQQLLDAVPAPIPSAALRRAIAEIPLRNAQPAAGFASLLPWAPFRSTARVLLSAVMVVLLGVLSGVLSADSDAAPDAAEAADWNDLSALALATDLDQELEP